MRYDDDMHDERGRPLTLAQACQDFHDAAVALWEATHPLPAVADWCLRHLTRGLDWLADHLQRTPQ